MAKMNQLEVGDWVKGKSKNGELIRGFIEEMDSYFGTVKINVVECDNENTIGRTVETLSTWVEKLPVSALYNEEQIRAVIDVALSVRDEAWFMELSEKLQSYNQEAPGVGKRVINHSIPKNRLGNRTF